MSPIDPPAIPKGSTVLITGASGFIGSHVADQFLKFGYNVRGTTRNLEKSAYFGALFGSKYGPGRFEMVAVPNVAAEGAFDNIVKGVSAIIHVATDFPSNPNPHEAVPRTVGGVVNALEAAAKEPSVKRFVLTSSSTAALIPKPDNPKTVTAETWNDEAIESAYRPPPYEPGRAHAVYAAGKTLGEKEAWKFVREKKPAFTVNAVLPNMVFGASLDPAHQGHPSTSGFIAEFFKGNSTMLGLTPAEYFIDVQDTALLHVAAAIHTGVKSERIFGFAEQVSGHRILAILRKLYPGRTFPAEFQPADDLSNIVGRPRAEELLRDVGQKGWTSLEESIRKNTEDLV